MIVLGVDYGRRTGLAVYDRAADRMLVAITVDADQAAGRILRMVAEHKVDLVAVEVNSDCVYPRHGQSARAMCRIAKNVGANQEGTRQLIKFLQEKNINTVAAPRETTNWDGLRKRLWDKAFRFTGKTSTHARDAAALARWTKI